ncbi:mannonate dehydratase [Aureibaculum sp. 2210JD6-5]|uniref:mannonate dehydratase n=1 Tax=Aureibaculum sp. 2210JD6-5 TaxID=3103957 RepID=UPI002AAE3110|nr:mannonate dehydratase [Aureibaculum sp. 2210JD6-5]MDY7395487.1 mannonate dehydratase [Aureibaculum sp. 2210JD6-5]
MEYLEKTFRWFGPEFGVTLIDVVQTGATGVVTALHHIPTGKVWSSEEIKKRKETIENANLRWSVVESVNVHESIKQGKPDKEIYIQNYIETLKNLVANDVKVVCYNFMPVLDWTRTDLDFRIKGSLSALRYNHIALAAFDLFILKRKEAENDYPEDIQKKAKTYFESLKNEQKDALRDTILAGLPGTRDVLHISEFQKHLDNYADIGAKSLKGNLAYFLKKVIPVAEELGVLMCIHPDDPPFSILGLPRVVSNYEDIKFLLDVCESRSNGLTFCSGSLGASENNDMVKIINDFGDKIHFIHLRNVKREENHSFHEANLFEGSGDMVAIMEAIIRQQKKRNCEASGVVGIPMRPDHGHVLLDDLKRMDAFYPGYSTLGRMKGLAELTGLELGIRHKFSI